MTKSAIAFRRIQSLTMPNGETIEVRKPNISRLIMETGNNAPEILRAQVTIGLKTALQGERLAGDNPHEVIEALIANMPDLSAFMDLVIGVTLVWPKIVSGEPDYENGEINLRDLSEDTRLILVRFALASETDTIPVEESSETPSAVESDLEKTE